MNTPSRTPPMLVWVALVFVTVLAGVAAARLLGGARGGHGALAVLQSDPTAGPSASVRDREPSPADLRATKDLLAPPLATDASWPPADREAPIGFVEGGLRGVGSEEPTSLQFGPDGRLYVGLRDGRIRVYTVARHGQGDYEVTASETIDQIAAIPNHDDLGRRQEEVSGRLLTGLYVTGTPDRVVVYATSSDPRIAGGPDAVDTPLDTNSGVLSRLSATSSGWHRTDLVRGLPRSRENHAPNGLALDEQRRVLYIAQGANTNRGTPSPPFGNLPEYALSGAILAVDLDAVEPGGYDLPTLEDPETDAHDPFGGHGGANQARIVAGGPVQVYSPGWRNAYDVVLTSRGLLYAIDNGPNEGWGGPTVEPSGAMPCSNRSGPEGPSSPDALHRIHPGGYAGHPNPTRAGAGPFHDAVPEPDPRQCRYVPNGADGALATIEASTNGLVEYTAAHFAGALRGDLLAAVFKDRVDRFSLDASGKRVVAHTPLLTEIDGQPLDVTAQGDDDIFPGTIWVALFVVYDAPSSIMVYEPVDDARPSSDAASARSAGVQMR